MRREYEFVDPEFATAVAASAFAIHSLEEKGLDQQRKEKESARPAGAAMRRPSGQVYKAPSSVRSLPSTHEGQKPKGTSRGLNNAESKADVWEKAELSKIRKRYEKLHSAIHSWENERKMRAKQQMEKRKNMLELTRSRIAQHYQNKLARIDHIARGARTQAEEKRKYEESVMKEKAKRIRETGNAPVTCFCF